MNGARDPEGALSSDSRMLLRRICLGTRDISGLLDAWRERRGRVDADHLLLEELLESLHGAGLVNKVQPETFELTDRGWDALRATVRFSSSESGAD